MLKEFEDGKDLSTKKIGQISHTSSVKKHERVSEIPPETKKLKSDRVIVNNNDGYVPPHMSTQCMYCTHYHIV